MKTLYSNMIQLSEPPESKYEALYPKIRAAKEMSRARDLISRLLARRSFAYCASLVMIPAVLEFGSVHEN